MKRFQLINEYYFTHSMKQSFWGKQSNNIVTQFNKRIDLVKATYSEVYEKFMLIRIHLNALECVNDLQNLDN